MQPEALTSGFRGRRGPCWAIWSLSCGVDWEVEVVGEWERIGLGLEVPLQDVGG